MLKNFERKFLSPLPLRPPYRPASMGQIVQFEPRVEFNPDVNVSAPLNIELGGLPLSLGLFLGSGLAFFIRSQVPQGAPQTLALLTGAGLAVAGITNLVMPKAVAASLAPAPGSSVPTTAAPSAPQGGVSAPPGIAASEKYAFDQISGRVSYPAETEAVDIWPTSSSYPIRIQLYNPSSVSATFYVEIVANETPHPFGDETRTTYPLQVTVGPGQTRDIDVNMPISSWGWSVDYVDVDLNVYKRRVPNEDLVRIATRFLVVE